tara:strand:+ start:13003 stop:15075 length:2073 start_codon:yes stop_codon:yes gene_type:complete
MKKEFKLLFHQKYLKDYVGTKFQEQNRLLLFHGLGSGKTCSAITAGLEFYRKNGDNCKIITITPASLKSNFEKELTGLCGINQSLNHHDNTNSFKKKLRNVFNIVSYQRFVKHIIPSMSFDKNTLLIVDEVQNIISPNGEMYHQFLKIMIETDVSVIFLSGTPIFNDSNELALLANLLQEKGQNLIDVKKFKDDFQLQIDDEEIDDDNIDDFIEGKYNITIKNSEQLMKILKNKISFFRGHDLSMYPAKTEYNVYCPMSKFQYNGYKESLGKKTFEFDYQEMSNAFLSGPRITSNVVYPDGGIGIKSAKTFSKFSSRKYAVKFNVCIRNIMKSEGPVFLFSNFVNSSGTNTFIDILQNEFGFQQYIDNESNSSSKVSSTKKNIKFAVYKAGQHENNCKILKTFNSNENKDGELIKIIIGSPTMKEGCSLLRTREVHILEPSWNESRTRQIIGRVVRYCSHIDLPTSCQTVKVFHYLAVSPNDTTKAIKINVNKPQPFFKENTVDMYMRKLSMYKDKVNSHYLDLMKKVAIDCDDFKKYNQPPEYTCHTSSQEDSSEYAFNIQQKSSQPKKRMYKKTNRKKKTDINIDDMMENLNNQSSSCPKSRKPDIKDKCPESFPFIKLNKTNVKCCYKRQSVTGCPKERRVVNGKCSETYPFMIKNKYDNECCYKKDKQKGNNSINKQKKSNERKTN